LGAAAAAMILLALIGGVIATAWQARVAARERDQARIEKVKAERVKDFLQEMLNSADPLKKGSNVKASDLLADAARRADALDNQPQLQAELRRTIGETYSGLGLYAQAEPLLRAALDSYRRLFGEDHPDTARTLYDLATLMRKQGNFQQAETIFRQTLGIQRKLTPQGDEATAETLFYLGEDLVQAGRTNEAETEITASLAMIRRVAGENHSLVALGQSTQGLIAEYRGDLSAAADLYRQSIATFRRLGPPNALESLVLMNLATNLTSQKKYDEAAATFREGIDLSRKLFGANHPNEAILLTHYGRMFYLKGDAAKAEELLTSALEIERKAWAPGHPDSAQTLATLGLVMTRAGKAKQAEGYLREALSIREKALPKGHWTTANVKSILGECLAAQRRYSEAAPLLQEGYDEIKAALGENHPRTLEALERLNQIRDVRKRP
jgi:tetratricopeptide (TPR) repeat protein